VGEVGAGEPRRRRRRGRRGGRRGRRGREDETAFPGLENGHTSIEPELFEAVEDFSGSPTDADIAPSPEPQPVVSVAAPPEQPRRGSTVREPAPVASSLLEPMPAMTPPVPSASPGAVPEEPKTRETSPPRKTGWWSKRLAGGSSG
jgi:ribonuclease E